MKALVAAAASLVLSVSACSHQPATNAHPPELRDGVYKFSERPPETSQSIEGTMTVVADTVIVDLASGICRYNSATSPSGPFQYLCDKVTLSFDRWDPVRRASYRTSRTITERKVSCVQYGTNAQGQRVCLQQQTDYVEREVPVSGTLHLVRVSNSSGAGGPAS